MFTVSFFYILLINLVCVLLTSSVFFFLQNSRNEVGGKISAVKSIWLFFVIYYWFLLPFFFFFINFDNYQTYILIISLHLVSMWIRGIIELVMIYKFYNWSPLYGITHTFVHFLGILLYVAVNFLSLSKWPIEYSLYLFILLVTLICEVCFAKSFWGIRGDSVNTKKIYFASDDPKWTKINRLTFNVLLFLKGSYLFMMFLSF